MVTFVEPLGNSTWAIFGNLSCVVCSGVCVVVCVCVRCGGAVAVWCVHSKPPCVDSKRARVNV